MHTFPSIDEVPMYIAFEGVFGTICCAFGVRGAGLEASEAVDGVRFGV